MLDNLINAAVYVLQVVSGLFVLLMLMRFLMQAVRADYLNPLCQAVVKITDPIIRPLRRIIPGFYGIDLSSLVIVLVVQAATLSIMILMRGFQLPPVLYLVSWSLVGIVALLLDVYFFALLILVIASWIAPYSNHPVIALVHQLTDPVCRPARRLLPPMGGIDFSIILVFLAITLIDQFLVIPPICDLLDCPRGWIIGL